MSDTIKKEWLLQQREEIMPLNFSSSLGISSRFASLLWARGFQTEEEVNFFLSPHLRLLEKPDKWPDIHKAASIISEKLLAGEKLAVWGDYDVDGVTGVCVVIEVLRHYGFDVLWHLPERVNEGYGLNNKNIEKLAQMGAQVLLTVDCGISDVDEVQKARDLNMTVIISDHHLSPESLPNAHALCNPRLASCPCTHLAGVGVAFFLMAELNTLLAKELNIEKFDMRQVLDLVALGTLADMVPLEGQNRILVKNGLLKITEAKRLGMAALKSVSKHNTHDKLSSRQIVFSLAPRINAAGRMASPDLAVRLLTETQKANAILFAEQLNELNDKRRKEERVIAELAITYADEQKSNPVLFVRHENWNQGIVGIVASRLVEKYHKPTFVFSKEGTGWKASARSIPSFDLHSGLVYCSSLLTNFGGHKLAAGLRVEEENYNEFIKLFTNFFEENIHEDEQVKRILTDGELSFAGALDDVFYKEIEQMQPFGISNSEPIFTSPPLLVKGYAVFGAMRNHVRLTLEDSFSSITLTIKIWSQVEKYPKDILNKHIKIAYSLNLECADTSMSDYIKIIDWQYITCASDNANT